MSNIIATTKRLIIRQIEDGDQETVYDLFREVSMMSNLSKEDEYEKIYRKLCWTVTNSSNNYNLNTDVSRL